MRTSIILVVGALACGCAHQDAGSDAATPQASNDPIQVTANRPGVTNAMPATPLSSAPLAGDNGNGVTEPPLPPAPPDEEEPTRDGSSSNAGPIVAETHPYAQQPAAASVTAMTQSNDPGDLKLVAAIRRTMTSDPSLSFAAKNVTVVTTGTNVYLRGTVRSAQERDRIEHIARSQAGAGNVDDGLVVTP